jgi:hypothetical protein
MVSISIFVLITALVIFKYGTFNQTVLTTNLAYDVAMTIRTAQTYGLGSKNAASSDTKFSYAYGVEFDMSSANRSKIILFNDSDVVAPNNGKYETGEMVSMYNITRGAIISALQVCDTPGSGCVSLTGSGDRLDILFKRPYPDAIINYIDNAQNIVSKNYARITIKATDNTIKYVDVYSNGQISVI